MIIVLFLFKDHCNTAMISLICCAFFPTSNHENVYSQQKIPLKINGLATEPPATYPWFAAFLLSPCLLNGTPRSPSTHQILGSIMALSLTPHSHVTLGFCAQCYTALSPEGFPLPVCALQASDRAVPSHPASVKWYFMFREE